MATLHRLTAGLALLLALFGAGAGASSGAPRPAGLPACTSPFAFPSTGMRTAQWIEIGRQLFYDPVLGGNREVACATCHHPRFATGDGVSLGFGDGGQGLGPDRVVDAANPPEQRIPRNASALFNLGFAEFSVMFHDGRVERLADGRVRTPLGSRAIDDTTSLLAVQALFPLLSPDEMAGHYGENEVSVAVRKGLFTGDAGAWGLIAQRVLAVPAYREALATVTDGAVGTPEEAIEHVARALAIFIAFEWRADRSPFDAYLCRGVPLDAAADRGMRLFYGKAGCAGCHAGRFQTDHDFHAIAMPQIGPGKKGRFEDHVRDVGRLRVTGRAEDAYRFRTPSLRNVAETAPYGHAGAYASLEAVVRHHLDPERALRAWSPDGLTLPPMAGAEDFAALADAGEVAAIAAANQLAPTALGEQEVSDLLAFLAALTDPASLRGRLGVPGPPPSGLPVPWLTSP